MKNNNPYVCTFNTFNDEFYINEFNVGQFIDSENNGNPFSLTDLKAAEELSERINKRSIEKYWNIGGPIEILKITTQNGIFIEENKKIFNGTQKELVNYFNNDLKKINGEILKTPHLEKYTI